MPQQYIDQPQLDPEGMPMAGAQSGMDKREALFRRGINPNTNEPLMATIDASMQDQSAQAPPRRAQRAPMPPRRPAPQEMVDQGAPLPPRRPQELAPQRASASSVSGGTDPSGDMSLANIIMSVLGTAFAGAIAKRAVTGSRGGPSVTDLGATDSPQRQLPPPEDVKRLEYRPRLSNRDIDARVSAVHDESETSGQPKALTGEERRQIGYRRPKQDPADSGEARRESAQMRQEKGQTPDFEQEITRTTEDAASPPPKRATKKVASDVAARSIRRGKFKK